MNKIILYAIVPLTLWLPCAASELDLIPDPKSDPATAVARDTAETIHVASLIAQSIGMERRLRHQGLVFEDAELMEYLTDILKKLADPEEIQRRNLRMIILKSRVVNAYAAPDGGIYITTGLLSRVTNEIQIAAILAHELGHIFKDHTARNLLAKKENARAAARLRLSPRQTDARSRRAKTPRLSANEPPEARAEYARIFSGGIDIAGDAFHAPAHDYLKVFETEADSVGIARLTAAGYLGGSESQPEDGMEKSYLSVKLWNVILYETSFLHAAGIFGFVEEQLDRLLEVDECDPAALIMRGDMERFMSPRSTASFQWYEKALRCDSNNRGALLSLGLAHYAVGHNDKAREHLKKYVEKAGDEIDIKMVTEVIRRCE